jgi:tryptophanyl-tRNA synthetase
LAPFRAKRAELEAQPGLAEDVLHEGAARARALARATMAEVRDAIGLLPARE